MTKSYRDYYGNSLIHLPFAILSNSQLQSSDFRNFRNLPLGLQLSRPDDPEPSRPQNLKPSLSLPCGPDTRPGQVGSPNFLDLKLKAHRRDQDLLRPASHVSRYLSPSV